MERRKFVKLTGMGLIGYNLAPFNLSRELINPLTLSQFFIRYILGPAASAAVKWATKRALDYWFPSDYPEEDCCVQTKYFLESKGYYPYQDDHNAHFFYTPPPKPPSIPSSGVEYGAFTFFKKSPSRFDENTQTVFIAKAHERKNIAAAIPESTMIASILFAKMLIERNYSYERIQQLLLPVEKGITSISKAYSINIFHTEHGTVTIDGEGIMVERDSDNIPIKLNGRIVLTPAPNKDSLIDDHFKIERSFSLENESLDFLYDSIKSGLR